MQRWYHAIIVSSRWIHLDELIYWDPTAECNGGMVPPLHHSFLLDGNLQFVEEPWQINAIAHARHEVRCVCNYGLWIYPRFLFPSDNDELD